MGSQNIFVVGTRAQLIKVAPVVVACERSGVDARLLMTGQHAETMQDLVDEFGLRSPQEAALPASERSTVASLARWLPAAYRGVSQKLRQAAGSGGVNVIVHGDTLSTVIGAACGRHTGAKVIHLESGLSSGRLFDPFPEELSRRLVFRWTDVALCPDAVSSDLMASRYSCEVVNTGGNTIIDAVRLAGADPALRDRLDPYLVASLHRFQNLYDAKRLRELVDILEVISETMPIVFVLHPATRNKLTSAGLLARLEKLKGIRLSPRLGYQQFLRMAAGSAGVLTDGGSNQEELAVLGVPTIIMRERTERVDGLGANAMMEGDVEAGLPAFIAGGGLEQLRRPVRITSDEGPSARIAKLLSAC